MVFHMSRAEESRQALMELLNERQLAREKLEDLYLLVLDSDQLRKVIEEMRGRVGFVAPFCLLYANDRLVQVLVFQHHPRFYWPVELDELASEVLQEVARDPGSE